MTYWRLPRIYVPAALLCGWLLLIQAPLFAQSSAPVAIDADSLEVRQDEGIAIFTGNVVARQNDLTLKAPRLIVSYGDNRVDGAQTIRTITAEDGVELLTPSERATARRGSYDVVLGQFVLLEEVRLYRDNNLLTGARLEYDTKRGESQLFQGAEAQVTARFLPSTQSENGAAASDRQAGAGGRGPVNVTANQLAVDHQREIATFSGDVIAVQDDMHIQGDRMRFHYIQAEATASATTAISQEAKLHRIDVEGRVEVRSARENVRGRKAVYDLQKDVITVEGDVILTRGQNVLRGNRLRIDVQSGQSRIDSGTAAGSAAGANRVRGLLSPDGSLPRPAQKP